VATKDVQYIAMTRHKINLLLQTSHEQYAAIDKTTTDPTQGLRSKWEKLKLETWVEAGMCTS